MNVCRGVLAFGFVSPWLLVGGLALSAVPLVIHLLRRRRYVDRPWAAMQFLQAALRSQARRVQLESLVLLAVRMLLIGAAAIAVARPYFDIDESQLPPATGRLRLLVVDMSLSMNAVHEGTSSLDRARSLAERIVNAAPPGDTFSLVRICRTPPLTVVPRAADDRSAVLEQVRGLPATQQRGDVAGALRAVQACLREHDSQARPEIVLISDFQATNWKPSDARDQQVIAGLLSELAEVAELTCLPVVTTPALDNLAVTGVRPVSGGPPGAPIGAAEVAILNASSQPARDVRVEVFAGQRVAGQGTVNIPAGGTALAQISLASLSPADTAISAEIPGDALADDNRGWGLLPDQRSQDVLLVSGRPRTSSRRGAADFVRLALAPADGAATTTTTVIDVGALGRTDLSRFDCVFLCDPPPLDDADAARLRAYVVDGGGLVMALGDQTRPEGFANSGRPPHLGLLPGELVQVVAAGEAEANAVRLAPGDYRHPVIQPFAGNPDAGLLTTEIERYWKLRLRDDVAAEVVLDFSTGDPAIVEQRLGAGRVFCVTTALDDSWGNWALWPSFVPVIQELTRAASDSTPDRVRIVGDALVRQLPPDDFAVTVQHISPEGAVREAPRAAQPDGATLATVVAESPGIHVLQLGPPRESTETYAVNADPQESRLEFLDRTALADLSAGRPVRVLTDWRPEAPVHRSGARGQLSRLLLLLVLGLLLVEQLMAWRFRLGAGTLILLLAGILAAVLRGSGLWTAVGFAAALLVALLVTLAARARLAVHRRGTSRP